jgi:hypothetical protein
MVAAAAGLAARGAPNIANMATSAMTKLQRKAMLFMFDLLRSQSYWNSPFICLQKSTHQLLARPTQGRESPSPILRRRCLHLVPPLGVERDLVLTTTPHKVGHGIGTLVDKTPLQRQPARADPASDEGVHAAHPVGVVVDPRSAEHRAPLRDLRPAIDECWAHNGAIQLKLEGELARLVAPSREQEPTMADVEGGVGGKLPSSLAVGLTLITIELDLVANRLL